MGQTHTTKNTLLLGSLHEHGWSAAIWTTGNQAFQSKPHEAQTDGCLVGVGQGVGPFFMGIAELIITRLGSRRHCQTFCKGGASASIAISLEQHYIMSIAWFPILIRSDLLVQSFHMDRHSPPSGCWWERVTLWMLTRHQKDPDDGHCSAPHPGEVVDKNNPVRLFWKGQDHPGISRHCLQFSSFIKEASQQWGMRDEPVGCFPSIPASPARY